MTTAEMSPGVGSSATQGTPTQPLRLQNQPSRLAGGPRTSEADRWQTKTILTFQAQLSYNQAAGLVSSSNLSSSEQTQALLQDSTTVNQRLPMALLTSQSSSLRGTLGSRSQEHETTLER